MADQEGDTGSTPDGKSWLYQGGKWNEQPKAAAPAGPPAAPASGRGSYKVEFDGTGGFKETTTPSPAPTAVPKATVPSVAPAAEGDKEGDTGKTPDGRTWTFTNGTWAPMGSTIAGSAKALGTGAIKGGLGLAGMRGDVGELGKNIAGRIVGEDKVKAISPIIDPMRKAMFGPTSQELQSALEKTTGPLYKPQGTTEEYFQTGGEFLPGLATPGGWLKGGVGILGKGKDILTSLAQKGTRDVVAPALGSETAGQAAKHFGREEYEPYLRVGGALAAGKVLPRMVTPLPMSAERKLAMDTRARVDPDSVNSLSAGRYTGSPNLEAFENANAGGKFNERMNRAFTSDINKRAGVQMQNPQTGAWETSNSVGPATMGTHDTWLNQRAANAFGPGGTPAARNQLIRDIELFDPIQRAAGRAHGETLTPADMRAATVRNDADTRRMATQSGPYDPLTRFGEQHMGPMQGSATGLAEPATSVIGALVSKMLGGDASSSILGSMIAPQIHALIGKPLSAAERKLFLSDTGQSYLKNQVLPGRTETQGNMATINALLGGSTPARLPPPEPTK